MQTDQEQNEEENVSNGKFYTLNFFHLFENLGVSLTVTDAINGFLFALILFMLYCFLKFEANAV